MLLIYIWSNVTPDILLTIRWIYLIQIFVWQEKNRVLRTLLILGILVHSVLLKLRWMKLRGHEEKKLPPQTKILGSVAD